MVKKKGISPIIASILLVVIVVILATIIFIWAKSFIKEAIKKNEMTADQACGAIKFDAVSRGIVNGAPGERIATIDVSNQGDVAIYQFNIKKIGEGKSEVEHVSLDEGYGLAKGRGVSFTLQVNYTLGSGPAYEYKQLILIPEILGTSKQSKRIYTCPENFGIEVDLT